MTARGIVGRLRLTSFGVPKVDSGPKAGFGVLTLGHLEAGDLVLGYRVEFRNPAVEELLPGWPKRCRRR